MWGKCEFKGSDVATVSAPNYVFPLRTLASFPSPHPLMLYTHAHTNKKIKLELRIGL